MEFVLDNKDGKFEFSLMLAKEIRHKLPIFVCVGSDRVVSDMIAPLVAELLVKDKIEAYVYGRLNNPIIAKNLHSAFDYINSKHLGKQIIVIDAGVGRLSDIGKVRFNRGGCIPAGAFGNSSVIYGDLSIMPIVSTVGIDAKTFLRCAKFSVVYELAKNIAECISRAVRLSQVINSKVV